jgi:lipopolysaccharide transport system ATP-binding protein
MSNPVIKAEQISKKFVLSHEAPERYQSLRDVIAVKAKSFLGKSYKAAGRSKEEFKALDNVSFEIEQGDRVGIIGRNGAGKSTLLKVLSRITEPTSGRITIRGRVASLLEVGTGFHPELSGRENIFLNGAILGMNRGEIKKKFDEIVAFAEIEKFLDTPVKRYSSGMYVRLAFAVAAHLEPEILVVDEVLAVGDAQFQKKCLGKMEEVSKNMGRTVLFVSHNMGVIANLCNKGFLMQNGKLIFSGKSSDAINLYLDNAEKSTGYQNDNNKSTSFHKVFFRSPDGVFKNEFAHNEVVRIELNVQGISQRVLDIGIAVLDKYKSKVFTSIKNLEINPGVVALKVECEIPHSFLAPGSYSLDVALFNSKVTTYEYISDILPFRIIDNGTELAAFENADYGNVLCNCTWTTLTL